jgi:hypothetical protein
MQPKKGNYVRNPSHSEKQRSCLRTCEMTPSRKQGDRQPF